MSAFQKWFEAQYGENPLPGDAYYQAVVVELPAARAKVREIERQVEAADLWTNRHTAALYAWQARERKP